MKCNALSTKIRGTIGAIGVFTIPTAAVIWLGTSCGTTGLLFWISSALLVIASLFALVTVLPVILWNKYLHELFRRT